MRLIAITYFLTIFFNISAHTLVDLQEYNPKIWVHLHTFTDESGNQINPLYNLFVEETVASRLTRIQGDLAKEGIGLIVYQGYLPPNPFDDSPHYRKGLGVDVDLYYLDGQSLAMPTFYGDVDAPAAYRDFPYLPAHVFHNRALLDKHMLAHGFVPQRENWWHYNIKGWQDFPSLTVNCDELTR